MNGEDRQESNREKKTTPAKKLFWCSKCDAQLVGQYGKCKNCGSKIDSKGYKQ